jgi:SOS response regulatory protein OraA/RecX
MNRFLLYGATGYVGRATAALAVERGLQPVLAGRSDSVRELAEELRRKGIEQTIIERSMQEADSCTEYEACLRLARKKVRSYRDENALRRKHKLFRYLAGKGFEYDLIQEVWAELEHGPKET